MSNSQTWCRVTVRRADGSVLAELVLHGASAPDLDVVQRLARLQLAARRAGGQVQLHDVTPDLWRLLNLAGLGSSLGQVHRQAERREKALGVEERVERADPPV